MLSRWSCLLYPSFFSQIEEGVKEPTLVFEKNRGRFSGSVVYLAYTIHIVGWVINRKLINGLIAASSGAFVW